MPVSATTLDQLTATDGVMHVDLSNGERSALASLATEAAAEASSAPDSLADLVAAAARLLPPRLVELGDRMTAWPPPHSGWLFRGLPIDESTMGPTPESWQLAPGAPTPEDCQLLLIGRALGTVFAWADQQGGGPVHNIVPVVGDEDSLLSSSSTKPLALHTEDAFFSDRSDFLLLLCLRNPCQAATYLSDVRNVELSTEQLRLAQSDRYFFRPDGSHGQGGPARLSWGFPVAQAASPQMAGPSALMGPIDIDPWLRCDIDYVDTKGDGPAMDAAHALDHALYVARAELVLRSGDLLIIDNRCCVHGRGRFHPTYAGQDRWLKRISISTRKNGALRNVESYLPGLDSEGH